MTAQREELGPNEQLAPYPTVLAALLLAGWAPRPLVSGGWVWEDVPGFNARGRAVYPPIAGSNLFELAITGVNKDYGSEDPADVLAFIAGATLTGDQP